MTLKSLPVRGHFYLFQFRDLFVFECSHVLWYICTNCWLNMLVNTRECVLGILKTFLIPEVTYLQAVKNCCFESPKNDIWSSPVGTWAIQLLHMIHQSTGKINPFNYMCPTYCYDVMCDVSKTFSYIQDAFFFRFFVILSPCMSKWLVFVPFLIHLLNMHEIYILKYSWLGYDVTYNVVVSSV